MVACADVLAGLQCVAKAIISRVAAESSPSKLGEMKSAMYCEHAAQQSSGHDFEEDFFESASLLGFGHNFNMAVTMCMLTGDSETENGKPRRLGLLAVSQLAYAIVSH